MDTTALLAAVGGADNVVEQEPCITRLRLRVVDPEKVDSDAIQELGARGVRSTGKTIQIVLGPQADGVSEELATLLPAAASQPGGLVPPRADAESPVVNLIIGSANDDEPDAAA